MKRINRTFVIFLMVLTLLPSGIFAQIDDCSFNYERALLLYNSGMADSALRIMRPCIENKEMLKNISKETRARIYRLAALSGIMTGNPEEAEKYARKMLINEPDYKDRQNKEDLTEFRLLLDKITPKPSLRLGVAAGVNIPFVKLQRKFSNIALQSEQNSFDGIPGFQFGIIGEKVLTKNISLEAGAGLNRVTFNYNISGVLISPYTPIKYMYEQKIKWIEVPVSAKYYFGQKYFRPFLEGGITGRLLLNSMEKSKAFGRYWFTNSPNSEKILTTFLTDFENFGILAGGGACYDLKKFSLRLDVRYNYFIKNSGSSSKLDNVTGYDDITPDEKFHYSDDINLIDLKQLQFSVGFLYNLNYRVF